MAEDPILAAKLSPDHHLRLRRRRHRCAVISSALAALLLVLLILLLTLVFRIREPIITLNRLTVDTTTTTSSEVESSSDSSAGTNISMTAQVSVKNPNTFPFDFHNTTTAVYYSGVLVGDGRGPGGSAGARRTIHMNVSMEVSMDRVFSAPGVAEDLDIGSGIFTMESYTKVPGKVDMVVLKKDAVIEMNCTVKYNLTGQEIRGQDCKRRVHLKI